MRSRTKDRLSVSNAPVSPRGKNARPGGPQVAYTTARQGPPRLLRLVPACTPSPPPAPAPGDAEDSTIWRGRGWRGNKARGPRHEAQIKSHLFPGSSRRLAPPAPRPAVACATPLARAHRRHLHVRVLDVRVLRQLRLVRHIPVNKESDGEDCEDAHDRRHGDDGFPAHVTAFRRR